MAATKIDFRKTLSEKAVATLRELQSGNNEYIDMYIEHLNSLSNLLFDIGDEMDIDESKNELFILLSRNRQLSNDLIKLKS